MIVGVNKQVLSEQIGEISYEEEKFFVINLSSHDKKEKTIEVHENEDFKEALNFCFSFETSHYDKFPTTDMSAKFSRGAYFSNLLGEMLSNSVIYSRKNPSNFEIISMEGLEGRIISIESSTLNFNLEEELNPFRRIMKRLTSQGIGLARATQTEFPISYEEEGDITTIMGRTDGIYSKEIITKLSYDSLADRVYTSLDYFLNPGD